MYKPHHCLYQQVCFSLNEAKTVFNPVKEIVCNNDDKKHGARKVKNILYCTQQIPSRQYIVEMEL